MKVCASLAILFIPEKPEMNKRGEVPIYIRITINGQRREISMSKWIKPETWDYNQERLDSNAANAPVINNTISDVRKRLEKYYEELLVLHSFVTADMLKRAYRQNPVTATTGEKETEGQITICEVLDIYISRFEEKVQKNKRKYRTLQK